MNRLLIYFVAIMVAVSVFCTSNVCAGQNPESYDSAIRSRNSRVDFYHLAVGLDVAASENYDIAPSVSGGIGSYRNLLNASAGVRIMFRNPVVFGVKDSVAGIYLPLFVSVDLNCIRWHSNAVTLGCEASYSFGISGRYYTSGSGLRITDNNITQNHFSIRPGIGVTINRFALHVFYEYDLRPSFNQKYIYECEVFDYLALHDSIFERDRVGVSISFLFPY